MNMNHFQVPCQTTVGWFVFINCGLTSPETLLYEPIILISFIHRRSVKPNLAAFLISCLHGKCLKEAVRPRAWHTLWYNYCVGIRWLMLWKSVFIILLEAIGYAAIVLKKINRFMCMFGFYLLLGSTRVPSTCFPAERSDSLSTKDSLARSIFQVPQWLVSVFSVSFGFTSSSLHMTI